MILLPSQIILLYCISICLLNPIFLGLLKAEFVISGALSLSFTQTVNSTPWSSRAFAYLWSSRNAFNYTTNDSSMIAPVSSFILYGGSKNIHNNQLINDVWVSPDQGYTWVKISNQSETHTFPSRPSNAFCSDPVSDQTYAIPNGQNNINISTPPIWATTDQINWTQILPHFISNNTQRSPLLDRSGSVCFVDGQSNLYYILGINASVTIPPLQLYNQSWWSQDAGKTWVVRASTQKFSPRYNSLPAVHFNNTHLGQVDVLYLLGGMAGLEGKTDLWASIDQGLNWEQINPYVLDVITSFATFYITPQGVLILAVFADPFTRHSRSEIWTSLDGGYTWGRCTSQAEYQARIKISMISDSDGYLYIMGGYGHDSVTFYNDIWRSDVSIYDWELWAEACNTTVPAAGVGLSQWPGVTESSSSSSSSSSTSTPLPSSSSSASSSSYSTSTSSSSSSSSSFSLSSSVGGSSSSSSSPNSFGSTGGPEPPISESRSAWWILGLSLGLVMTVLLGLGALMIYSKKKYGRLCCCWSVEDSSGHHQNLLSAS